MKRFVPKNVVDLYHLMWPFLGALIYRFPSRKLKVIGITGTNGKTTVTHLASDILEGAGYKVASISSLRFKIGENEWKNELKMTMPGRMKIQKFLRDAVDAGCKYEVMEVTSEGIKQHRHNFVRFDTAVFTNLTPEHIESHGGLENYKKAKGKLFQAKHRISVVNLDDESAEYFLNFPVGERFGYGINPNVKIQMSNQPQNPNVKTAAEIKMSNTGVDFFVDDIAFHINLLGKFNVYNALAAICIGLSQDIAIEKIKEVLEKTKSIPGRMEIVTRNPFSVVVDYAHTPDALQKVYETIRENYKLQTANCKLICVLGAAGGGRDKWKRPEMGKIAAQYCDEIILTDEDSYDEDPLQIIAEIKKGIDLSVVSCQLSVVVNRREAIKKALRIARPVDTVIITGKGAEPWMMTKEGRVPWDDRDIVKSILGLSK